MFQRAKFTANEIMQGELKEFACFFYMLEGSLISYDNRGAHRINKLDGIAKNCGRYVQQYVNEAGDNYCEAIAVYLYPELLKKIYSDDYPKVVKGRTKKPNKYIANELVERYMNGLALYFEESDVIDEELSILKIKELILILLRSSIHKDVERLLLDIFSPAETAFKTIIENNIFNPLSMPQLAYISNMSLSTFKRTFKKVFNETPAKYIKNRRLEAAATQLLNSTSAIQHIAFDVGFQDVTTFTACFTEKFGKSPSNYRLNQDRN